MEKVVVIPSLNPDDKFVSLIQMLKSSGYEHIVVVNDGSSELYSQYFSKAIECGCDVLTHSVNLGKGRALKTAFNYIIGKYKGATAVCIDADGQHTLVDMEKCLNAAVGNEDKLVIGCRTFSDRKIPFRSRFGNILTRNVFKILCGISISDTQTGLRVLSDKLMRHFITIKGERFEYEMNMLIDCKESGIDIVEVPIETIYLFENKSSHFNPLKDSMRVYSVFAKFFLSAMSSFIVDIGLFTLIYAPLLFQTKNSFYAVFIATGVARLVSSLLNFMLNRHTVFKTKEKKRIVMTKYYCLAVVQFVCSAQLVNLAVTFLPINATFIKIVVDLLLFIVSFNIQREWVFKK